MSNLFADGLSQRKQYRTMLPPFFFNRVDVAYMLSTFLCAASAQHALVSVGNTGGEIIAVVAKVFD